MSDDLPLANTWQEADSQIFSDYGQYFVPERERQIALIAALVPPAAGPAHVLELCCGEGLLAEALLEHRPNCAVHGYDGSALMRKKAASRLHRFGARFETKAFELAAADWRQPAGPVHAVVSSLAVHHLDGSQKRQLFRDVFQMLASGGVFVLADLVQPAGTRAIAAAAAAWDRAVQERALALDGNSAAFDYFRENRWNLFRYPDPMDKPSGLSEQLQWLAAAGFTAVDAYWVHAGHAVYGGCKV
jgi:cyclopropane fatty-acyl-phospholipid synthase-like methyltransferase